MSLHGPTWPCAFGLGVLFGCVFVFGFCVCCLFVVFFGSYDSDVKGLLIGLCIGPQSLPFVATLSRRPCVVI